MSKRRWMTMNAGLALIVAGLMLPLAIERAFGQAPVFGAWTELGPQRFYGLKPKVSGTELMSGQPSSIAVDLVNDSAGNTVYVATAGGGVWKSTNGLSATPQFVPISDPSLPLASGAIALDSRTNPPTIYVGTGDPDNPSNVNSYAGNGILISRDGGQTWTHVTSADGGTHPFKGMGFSRIIVDPTDPNVVLAATGVGSDGNVAHSAYPQENPAFDHLGIYRSADGGHTWSLVKHTPISGNNVNGFFHIDLAYEPVGDRFLAAISNQGLFASADGITWQPSDQMGITTSGLAAPEDMHRVSLATRNGTLWALVIAIPYPARPDPCTPTNGCPVYEAHELYELAPAAASWRRIDTPLDLAHKGFLGYVAAPPGSSGLVVAAEHLFRTDDISPSSPDWHHIEFGATASLHGDQHAIAFVDADQWYVGDDGGMFATHVRGQDWRSLNATLRTTEFYSATSDSTDSGAYVGGQQDNGQAVSSDERILRLGAGRGYQVPPQHVSSRRFSHSQVRRCSRRGRGVSHTVRNPRERSGAVSGGECSCRLRFQSGSHSAHGEHQSVAHRLRSWPATGRKAVAQRLQRGQQPHSVHCSRSSGSDQGISRRRPTRP
jgi:hypothetical protein